MPAPVAVPEVDPSLIVSPEKLTAPVVVTLKRRKFNEEPRRTVSLSAPGPVMAMLVLRSESAWLKLMVHFPVEGSQLGSVAGIAKIIVSSPAVVFAVSIAARKVHRPPRTLQFVKVPGSALLLTANTDPASGVTPSRALNFSGVTDDLPAVCAGDSVPALAPRLRGETVPRRVANPAPGTDRIVTSARLSHRDPANCLPERSIDRCNFIVFTPAKQSNFVDLPEYVRVRFIVLPLQTVCYRQPQQLRLGGHIHGVHCLVRCRGTTMRMHPAPPISTVTGSLKSTPPALTVPTP